MTNNTKVLRGGSWFNDYNWILRCSCRDHDPATLRANNVGFRLVGEMREKVAEKLVLRGGSWVDGGRLLRSSCRDVNHPANRDIDVGLRLVGTCTKRLEKCDE